LAFDTLAESERPFLRTVPNDQIGSKSPESYVPVVQVWGLKSQAPNPLKGYESKAKHKAHFDLARIPAVQTYLG
jgi:hypothetical protein